MGYNLWKGNNQLSKVEGYGKLEIVEFKNLQDKVKSVNQDKYYEINWDNIFLKEAKDNIEKEIDKTPKYLSGKGRSVSMKETK